MKKFTLQLFCLISFLISANLLFAQTPIKVGSGSYASSIPSHETEFWDGNDVNVKEWTDNVPLYVLDGVTGPYPTNDWWTPLLFHNNVEKSFNLWAHPICASVQPTGVSFHYPDSWSGLLGAYDETMIFENPEGLNISSENFTPSEQRVKSWGDYSVQFRILESATKFMDITIAHGMPYLWIEYSEMSNAILSAPQATFFNDQNQAVTLPQTTDHIGLNWNGRNYGIFAADGSEFTYDGNNISINFPADQTYLIIAALPQATDLAFFHQYAYNIPENTTVNWTYQKEAGKLITNWNVSTRTLKGTETGTIQGWIPHHYKNTQLNFPFTGHEYATSRGLMKCATGNEFEITYDYKGALSQLPMPEEAAPDTFNLQRLENYISDFSFWQWPFNTQTYAGGKQVAMFARYLTIAKSLNHVHTSLIEDRLRSELEDFFTYTPGEQSKYFAYSEHLTGLIGFDCGYGSHRFNDHHFHYGYYVYAYAVLSLYDEEFKEKYKDIAKLIAKEYANWERDDQMLPLLRTFDVWEGHSWAGGGYDNSPVFGENQESSSEAMMSWSALLQMGDVLNDKDILAAGVFGYVSEGAATNEYWFDRSNQNLPQEFGAEGKISSITWGNQIQYTTFFGAEPMLVHGIQYIPVLPSSYYLVQNYQAAQTELDFMIANSSNPLFSRFTNFEEWPTDWGNQAIRYAAMVNPQWAVDRFEQWYQRGDAKAFDQWESGLSYYFLYSNYQMGRKSWSHHINASNSGVFYNPDNQQYTYCAYNSTNQEKAYTVYENGIAVGHFIVPANSFGSTHSLINGTPPAVELNTPGNNQNFNIGSNIQISAVADDFDGTISSVEFYINDEKFVANFTNNEFTYTMSNAEENVYQIYAKAIDNEGLGSYSDEITITVGNIPPVVYMITPKNNQYFFNGDTVKFSATSTDEDGTIEKVEFFINNQLVSTNDLPDYEFSTNNLESGEYNVYAKSTDNNGKTSTSKSVNIVVKPYCNGTDPGQYNDFTYAIQSGNPYQTINFYPSENNPTPSFVDLIYTVNGQEKGGVQMVKQEDGRFNFTFLASQGDVISWRFVYGVPNTGQRVSTDFTYTIGGECTTNYNIAPQVDAGDNLSVETDGGVLSISGSAIDSDGTIISYHWEQTEGLIPLNISDANSKSISISDYEAGVYVLRLNATDNSGNTGYDEMTLTVNPMGNLLPIADAGNDMDIFLPQNSITISGSGTDPDGTITSYNWKMIAGNTNVVISGENTTNLSIENLIEGNYTFELTVTDNALSTASDRMNITIHPEEILCTGDKEQYTYEINSENINPTITYYPKPGYENAQYVLFCYQVNWDGQSNMPCTQLTAQPFEWQLSAGDGDVVSLYFASDLYPSSTPDVLTIGENCGTYIINNAPVADAGPDIQITDSQTSIDILGSGTDSDPGSVLTYEWEQIIGPNQATLQTNGAALSAHELIDGIYIFRLTVTDEKGAFTTDDVAVWKTGITVGFPEIEHNTAIYLFPNPASDFINVRSNELVLEYTITNMNGKTLMNKEVENFEFDIAIGSFNKGCYLITFKTSTNKTTNFFIKQ